MTFLLDTHALLRFLLDDERLSATARKSIQSASEEIYVSPASLWEVAIKVSLGKYALPVPFARFWEQQFRTNDLAILPLSVLHFDEVSRLPFHHRDPIDRLIVAQARVDSVPVISLDEALDQYGVERVW